VALSAVHDLCVWLPFTIYVCAIQIFRFVVSMPDKHNGGCINLLDISRGTPGNLAVDLFSFFSPFVLLDVGRFIL